MDGTWSVNVVGKTAGEVWHFLKKNGASSLSAVEKGVKAPGNMVTMAIGWLAREGKLSFVQEKRSVKVSLKD